MSDASHSYQNRILLRDCLDSGRLLIGQILLGKDYSLRHSDDVERLDLNPHTSASDAREIARYDEKGVFRPLKTAPNLRRGWLLRLSSLEEMELALEYFYPSALGLWNAFLNKKLHATSMTETLNRQTGMYRITQLLTPQQAGELVAQCCTSDGGCLRSILWDRAPGEPLSTLPSSKLSLDDLPAERIPLICRELCNLVVAAARPIAKGNLPKKT
jgi:sirohydrochlorin cobaltochelatase